MSVILRGRFVRYALGSYLFAKFNENEKINIHRLYASIDQCAAFGQKPEPFGALENDCAHDGLRFDLVFAATP